MILIPKTTPSKMAMPVLNERMSESALLAAGARGENISRVVAVIARFLSLNFIQELLLRWVISSNVILAGVCALITSFILNRLKQVSEEVYHRGR